METLRTFIAFPLPRSVRDHIRAVQEALRASVLPMRWVSPENVHLTLKFLGNVTPNDLDPITLAMADTVRDAPPIRLEAGGIGIFPGISRPRVLWIGLKGETHPLIEIRKRLDQNLSAIGFPEDERPFKAHLTIGRAKVKPDSKALVAAMEAHGNSESAPFTAEEMILFRSELKPVGAIYTRLASAFLREK